MSHLFERESKNCCLFAIEEKRSKFCFYGRSNNKSNIAHKVKNAPFTLMGLVGFTHQPTKKMSTSLAVGVRLRKIQPVRMVRSTVRA